MVSPQLRKLAFAWSRAELEQLLEQALGFVQPLLPSNFGVRRAIFSLAIRWNHRLLGGTGELRPGNHARATLDIPSR